MFVEHHSVPGSEPDPGDAGKYGGALLKAGALVEEMGNEPVST